MKKVLFASILMLNFSIANAQGFDWMRVSKEVNVGNEYTAVVSKVKYGARWEADGHCRQLGRQVGLDMRLADLQEVIEIAAFGKPQPTDMMVVIKSQGKGDKIAIVAWDNKKAIKVNTKNPSIKDTQIVYQYRGGGAGNVTETSLKDMIEKDTVVDYQDEPVKKLPAICVHNKK